MLFFSTIEGIETILNFMYIIDEKSCNTDQETIKFHSFASYSTTSDKGNGLFWFNLIGLRTGTLHAVVQYVLLPHSQGVASLNHSQSQPY